MSSIFSILNDIVKESDEILGICVFDYLSGVSIADKSVDSKIDLSIPAAYFSEFMKHSKENFKQLGLPDSIDECLIKANNFFIIIKSIKNMKYHVLCYISLTGNQSFVKEILKKYEDPLSNELQSL